VDGDLASHELLVVGQPVFAFYVDIKVRKYPKAAATAFISLKDSEGAREHLKAG
jgi:hypothetical protein